MQLPPNEPTTRQQPLNGLTAKQQILLSLILELGLPSWLGGLVSPIIGRIDDVAITSAAQQILDNRGPLWEQIKLLLQPLAAETPPTTG